MDPIFGYHIPSFTFPGVPDAQLFDRVVGLAQAAEGAGFDLVTVMDHFYQIALNGSEDQPMLEAYPTLAALAMKTSRVKLATMVTGVTYRNPAHLAKLVTTLDVISGGRAILGIGAAWNESEHAGYGFDFPPIKERMDRLDEALAICTAMFREERPSFTGRFYRIDQALNVPRPIQPRGPQIMIGGGGEQRTLRLVAKYADISHWFPLGMEELKRKTAILEGYCAEIGRDSATIRRMMASPVVLVASEADGAALLERLPPERRAMMHPVTPARGAEIIGEYVEAGFAGFTFSNQMLRTPDAIGLAGELISLVRK